MPQQAARRFNGGGDGSGTPPAGVAVPKNDGALAAMLEALPVVERQAVQARLSTCPSLNSVPRSAAETLLYVPRLPRTGNALMCKLLGTCSARQSVKIDLLLLSKFRALNVLFFFFLFFAKRG